MRTNIDDTLDIGREAHDLLEIGYHLVPIGHGGKVPLITWKDADCTHRRIDEWLDRFGPDLNIAIHAGKSGIVGLDADTDEAAGWIERHCPPTPMIATTPRGGRHAYFRAPGDPPPPATNLFGIGLDVRSVTSLLIASPSYSREHGRRWEWRGEVIPPEQLPVIDARLISRQPSPRPRSPIPTRPVMGSVGPIRDVTRWIMSVPSVQGSCGSSGCYKVACRLVDAGFTREEALRWLRGWNERVPEPPWSDRELEHKFRSAFNR